MQHDEVIWQAIRHNHCSFMAKIETGIFCRNPYNVSGICNKSSCPLANSRFGIMMMYWPKFLVHKTKQRLTNMTQMRMRMRRLDLKTREKIMTMPRKQQKRESRRENGSKLGGGERAIVKKLIKGLIEGAYPANVVDEIINKCMSEEPAAESEDEEEEHEMGYFEDFDGLGEEDDMEDAIGKTSVYDNVEKEDEEEESVTIHRKRDRKESFLVRKKLDKDPSKGKLWKKSRGHVEVEHEETGGRHTTIR